MDAQKYTSWKIKRYWIMNKNLKCMETTTLRLKIR